MSVDLRKTHDDVKADCRRCLESLKTVLARAERHLEDDEAIINTLGELQSAASIFDCRLATLGQLRQMIQDE